MLTCRDASHLISEQQERPLNWRKRLGLRLHLMMCVSCRRFERQIAVIRKGLRKLGRSGEPDEGVGLSTEARERIRTALAECCDHEH